MKGKPHKVKLVPTRHGCYDYACGVCQRVYPFFDQALDCALGHKLERTAPRWKPRGRGWDPRRF